MVKALEGQVDEAIVGDIDALDLGGRRFDRVLCMGALDFVLDPGRAFAKLCALTKEGGRLAVQVPRANPFGALYAFEKRLRGIRVNLFPRAFFEGAAREAGLRLLEATYPLPHNMVLAFERPAAARGV
jgi:SAM-dependent methyltransferase